jgi:hypothetical protein
MCRTRRLAPPSAWIGLVLALLLVTPALAGCTFKPKPTPSIAPTGKIPPGAAGELDDAGPVAAPESGALFGAFAMAADGTETAQVMAVQEMERRIGRRLDIVHTYAKFNDDIDTLSNLTFQRTGHTLLLSWAGADTRVITGGDYDQLIHANAQTIKAMEHPVMLEWRWEMDRPNLRAEVWSPDDYVAAWKHIQDIFRAEQVENVSWVWCPTAQGFGADGDAPAFYPGDDRVDWLCANAYPTVAQPALKDVLLPFLQWAAQHPKPVLIGEYGVSRSLAAGQRAKALSDDANVFQADSQIRAVSYFDGDPDGNPPTLLWGIRDDPTAANAFATMARDAYFNPAGQVLTAPG